jgi:hypothetical protein
LFVTDAKSPAHMGMSLMDAAMSRMVSKARRPSVTRFMVSMKRSHMMLILFVIVMTVNCVSRPVLLDNILDILRTVGGMRFSHGASGCL